MMERSLIDDARFCFLPECRNNSKHNPDLTFVALRKSLKQEWCRIVGRNCPKRQLHCCERHLNLEKDLENYWQWKLMGTTPKMSANAILRNVNIVDSNQLTSVAENPSPRSFAENITSLADTQQDTLTSTSTVERPMVDTGVQAMPQTKNKETNYLNLEKDPENYWQWKLMATPKIVAENPGSFVENFTSLADTQQDTLTSTSTVERPIMVDTGVQAMPQTKNKERNYLNLEKDPENYWQWKLMATPKIVAENPGSFVENFTSLADTQQDTLTSTSTVERPIMVDTGVQAVPQTKDKETNYVARKPYFKKRKLRTQEVASGSDNVVQSASWEVPSSSGATTEIFEEKSLYGRNHILKMIEGNPKAYIGLPKNMFWLADHIAKQYKTHKLYIFMTLFKLKQNDTLGRIKDEFELSAATVQNHFYKTTIILASYFQNFIFWPDAIDIKKNLPLSFKIRYSNVQCIIDCFEIEIERPSDPKKQASTWSQYKSCNTVKYLIGCTPNGLVNFVSPGYGGRISDKAIVEKSGFIDILPPNSVIMADRGFKEVQTILKKKNVTLLRPPSVSSKDKPTKKEVIETKVIASLRVHIERVIRRLREFRILKPHSVINHKHVNYLDEYVIIACGLINLQNALIKSTI